MFLKVCRWQILNSGCGVTTKEGRTFCVEPIDNSSSHHAEWGDVDPATKKLMTGSYDEKHKGAIHEDESIITKENGFKNIMMLPAGVSPARKNE